MFKIAHGRKFVKSLSKLNKEDRKRVIEKIGLLQENPKHPSLNTHWNVKRGLWQSNISGRLRVLWDYGPEENIITLVLVESHEIVE